MNNDLETKFDSAADEWIARTRFSSSLEDIFSDQKLVELVQLGPAILPFVLARFENEPERWHHVLVELSGLDPLGPDTTSSQAKNLWVAALGFESN